jgi:hypothetical protein
MVWGVFVRVWDVNPGYLNRQSLLGEHRELHAIVSIIRNNRGYEPQSKLRGIIPSATRDCSAYKFQCTSFLKLESHNKKGYSRHPETLRWIKFGWALNQRHRLLAAEMNLRGYVDRSPVLLKTQYQKWPDVFVDLPVTQFSILAEKYINKDPGRIPLPRNVQQLWAQHKYSVMARDNAEYKRIGRLVASRKTGNGISDLYPELVSLLRCPPGEGNLRNAVQHMWEYVSGFASLSGKAIERKTTQSLLKEIQRLAFLHDVVYLKESTALGELQA